MKESSDKITFTVSDASVEASKVYLKCSSLTNTTARGRAGQTGQEAEKEKKCIVQISVWGPPIKGSNEYPTPDACKENGPLSLEVNSSKKSVTFACGDNETLSRELFDMVFSTNECATSSALAEHLSGASLVQHASTTAADDKPAYTFSVTSLPTEEKTLCYQCTKKNAQMKGEAQNTCKVLIKVAKQETDTGSTTVAPTEESRAEHGRWNTALMISLITIPVVLMKMLL